MRTLAVFFLTACLALPASADVARVIDGDTIELAGRVVDLYGIDAPELGQRCNLPNGGTWPCGEAAARVLNELVGGARLTCTDQDAGPDGRVTSVCLLGGLDVNRQMVRDGFAWAAEPTDGDYIAAQQQAKDQSIGVWWIPTQPPWEYRVEQWDAALATAPSGCPIKGRVMDAGAQIYLTPWSPGYMKAGVLPEKGERWFCSEREALDSGWRSPAWNLR